MSKIKDLINDDKPREQAKAKGIENLTNSSLLALIINSGIKGYSCIDLANEVLKKCTSVDNLINLTYNDLISIKGMKDAKVYRILSLIELVKRINSNINKKIDIIHYDAKVFAKEFIIYSNSNEKMFVLLYKNKYRVDILKFSSYSNDFIRFSLNSIKKRILEKKANEVLLIHNHESEYIEPSNDDIFTTFFIESSLREDKVLLIDHLIVSQNGYFSFKEHKIF